MRGSEKGSSRGWGWRWSPFRVLASRAVCAELGEQNPCCALAAPFCHHPHLPLEEKGLLAHSEGGFVHLRAGPWRLSCPHRLCGPLCFASSAGLPYRKVVHKVSPVFPVLGHFRKSLNLTLSFLLYLLCAWCCGYDNARTVPVPCAVS